MSWNLLAYGLPLISGVRTFSLFHPAAYSKYEKAPKSPYSQLVSEIAERIFQAEIDSGGTYRERIQEMLEDLPDSSGVKDVKALIAYRLRVVSIENKFLPIHSTGTDVDSGDTKGALFIGIDPGLEGAWKQALPWIATHEICHLLEEDWIEISAIKTVACLAVTILATAFFGWGLVFSVCAAMSTNIIAHVVASHRAENRADDFANKYCSVKERQDAIAYFQHIKGLKAQKGGVAYGVAAIKAIFHPSEDPRIAKIQKTFESKRPMQTVN